MNDVGLKKRFSLSNTAMDASTCTDLMIEVMFFLLRTIYHTHQYGDSLTLHPKFSFVHTYYPGFVHSLLVSSSSSTLLSLFPPLITGLTYPFIVSAEDCAEYMWHALLSAKEGFSRSHQKGDDIGMKQYFGK